MTILNLSTFYIIVVPIILAIFVIGCWNFNLNLREGLDNSCPIGCKTTSNITGNASDILPHVKGSTISPGCFRYVYDICDPSSCVIPKGESADYCKKNNICEFDTDCKNCANPKIINVKCPTVPGPNNTVVTKDAKFDSQGCPEGYNIKYCSGNKLVVGDPTGNIPASLLTKYNARCYGPGQTCVANQPSPKVVPPDGPKPAQPGSCDKKKGFLNCGVDYFPSCQKVSSKDQCTGYNKQLECTNGFKWDESQKMCVPTSQDPSSSGSGSGLEPEPTPGNGPSTGSASNPKKRKTNKINPDPPKAYQDSPTLLAYDSVWNLYH